MIPPRILRVTVGPAGVGGQSWTYPTQIDVDVKIDGGSKPNRATAKIWNLGPGALSWIEAPDQQIQIVAGDGAPSQIFIGDVLRRQTITESLPGGGIVTTIQAKDGYRRFMDGYISRAYPPGTARDVALGDALAALGLVVGYRSPTLAPLTMASGYEFTGAARDMLSELLAMDFSSWTIQQGAVYIFAPHDGAVPGVSPVLSAASGLMGSPKRKDGGAVEVRCRLQPAFCRIGMGFTLASRWVNGIFKVTRIGHRATADGATWETSVEGKPVIE